MRLVLPDHCIHDRLLCGFRPLGGRTGWAPWVLPCSPHVRASAASPVVRVACNCIALGRLFRSSGRTLFIAICGSGLSLCLWCRGLCASGRCIGLVGPATAVLFECHHWLGPYVVLGSILPQPRAGPQVLPGFATRLALRHVPVGSLVLSLGALPCILSVLSAISGPHLHHGRRLE